MTHLLVDANNLFHRAKHVTQGDVDIKGGMALHIIFASINKIWKKFNGTHVVVALEGPNNWRKTAFATYKGHRVAAALQRSQREREEDEIYFEYMNEFVRFMSEHTNTSVISVPGCEADDVIARWIQLHPDTNHVIISSDSDFLQLLAPNVQIYNGITQETINIDGWFDDKDKPVINKKNKQIKEN
jgi:5'-3' exonuclease